MAIATFAVASAVEPAASGPVQPSLKPLPISAVRLLDGPFKTAQELDRKVLLETMSADRFLSRFRSEAGLAPKAPSYGGWENEGVAGQTGGHYLSALSLMWQATGDAQIKARIDYMVAELAECQRANGDGYVSAIPGGRKIFNDIKAGGKLHGWVPWYTMHKLLAGLRDAWTLAGNATAKEVLVKLGDWTCGVIAGQNEHQMQDMLGAEHGGMAEVMADLYVITADAKYLMAAKRFCHRALLDPLSQGIDNLDGWHANTQIPKVIGFERIHELTGEVAYGEAARFFWSTVTGRRSWVNGGNSDNEHFFPWERARDHIESAATAETCNTYNMLRLSRQLYGREAKPAYVDYIERALYNQILGAQEPKTGMFTYFQPLRSGHFRIYSSPTDSGWCCLGTGMENPGRFAESAFWTDDLGITVALFLPAEAQWSERGVALRQTTKFPAEDTVTIAVTKAPGTPFALRLRSPVWLSKPMEVTVNGKPAATTMSDGVVAVTRAWQAGDTLTARLPMAVRLERLLPQDHTRRALTYGPVVLCGDLGTERLDGVNFWQGDHNEKAYSEMPVPTVPVLIAPDDAGLLAGVVPVPGQPLTFTTKGIAKPQDVILRPYSGMHFVRYVTYWRTFTPESWVEEEGRVREAERMQRELDARTIVTVRPGEQQDEVNFKLASEGSSSGVGIEGRRWRHATGFFSYTLPTGQNSDLVLSCTYWGNDRRRFAIQVDGTKIADVVIGEGHAGRYFDEEYPIPNELVRGKTHIVVRFDPEGHGFAGGIFGVRLLRAAVK